MSMPISLDLDHITGPFLSIGAPQLKPIAEAFERLGQWLTMRVMKVDLLDQASSAFPVVEFYNEAVTLWVDPVQHGALSPNETTLGDRLASAGRAFVTGLKRAPEAIGNEQILSRFLATAHAGLQAIVASMDRFEKPTKSLFDPRLRTASDLFGEAALLFRSLQSSKTQVKTFLCDQALPAYRDFKTGSTVGESVGPTTSICDLTPDKFRQSLAGSAASAPAQAALETPETLDRLTQYIAGALLILPQLPELLISVWQTFDLFVRSTLLEKFAGIEKSVYGLRATLIDTIFVKLRLLLQEAAVFVDVAALVIVGQANFWLDFAYVLGARLLLDLDTVGNDLLRYLRDVVTWIQDKFLVRFNDILNFDLIPLIDAVLGPIGAKVRETVGPSSITILDLVHEGGRELLSGLISAVRAALIADVFTDIPDRLDALNLLVNILGTPIGRRISPHVRPIVPPPFPSVATQFLKTKSAEALQASLANLAATAPDRLAGSVDATAKALQQASYRFDAIAATAANAGSITQFAIVAKRAVEQANRLFGPEADALRKKIDEQKDDEVVKSFESWLTSGGFFTIGSVLDQYVTEVLGILREKQEKGEEATVIITQTSPQILARRAALGRARMQQMTFDARGRKLDDDLVAGLAASFRTAVQSAYQTGTSVIQTAAPATQ